MAEKKNIYKIFQFNNEFVIKCLILIMEIGFSNSEGFMVHGSETGLRMHMVRCELDAEQTHRADVDSQLTLIPGRRAEETSMEPTQSKKKPLR